MTNQIITFNTLDSYFLNTGNGKLNIGFLRDSLLDHFDVTWRSTNAGNGKNLLSAYLENGRRSIRALVWQAFTEMTNEYIQYETCADKYSCSSEQLKKYLAQYGYTLEEALQPVIDEVKSWRENLKAGKEI